MIRMAMHNIHCMHIACYTTCHVGIWYSVVDPIRQELANNPRGSSPSLNYFPRNPFGDSKLMLAADLGPTLPPKRYACVYSRHRIHMLLHEHGPLVASHVSGRGIQPIILLFGKFLTCTSDVGKRLIRVKCIISPTNHAA